MEITRLSQIQKIEDFGGITVHQAEKLLRDLRKAEYDEIGNMDYPKKPYLLSKTPTQEQIDTYQSQLSEYEKLKEKYDDLNEKKRGIGNQQYQLLEEYVKYKTGFFTDVPAQYKDKVWRMAWELGHSSGYGEVSIYLSDLVDIFR
jgi:hypothetical protein